MEYYVRVVINYQVKISILVSYMKNIQLHLKSNFLTDNFVYLKKIENL